MTDYTFIADILDKMVDVPPETIISRSIFRDGGLNVTLFRFAAGQELTEHTAARPAVLYFVDGRARLTLGTDEHRADKGSWVHMPAQLAHSIFAETEVTMLLLLLPGTQSSG